jgi:uncharacterized membrane protein
MWQVLLVPILACSLYHFCLKKIPSSIHPFMLLSIVYIIGLFLSIACYFLIPFNTFVPFEKPAEFSKQTWIFLSLVGLSVVGIEFGFMLAYRNGFSPSFTPVLVTAAVGVVLYPIMILFQGELLQFSKIFGAVSCLVGIYYLAK